MSTRYLFNKLKSSIPAVCQMNFLLWRRARHAVGLKNYARATSGKYPTNPAFSLAELLTGYW